MALLLRFTTKFFYVMFEQLSGKLYSLWTGLVFFNPFYAHFVCGLVYFIRNVLFQDKQFAYILAQMRFLKIKF